MNEREGFEKAIHQNFYDEVNRKVFADWLDDHDEPELADHHRNWSAVRYHHALVWMKNFAEEYNLSFEEAVEAGRTYIKTGEFFERFNEYGNTTPLNEGDNLENYWDAWSMLNDTIAPENMRKSIFTFYCSC